MADKNPNITGGDLVPVSDTASESWRYKDEDGLFGSYPDYDNRLSDNDSHQQNQPIQPVIKRR